MTPRMSTASWGRRPAADSRRTGDHKGRPLVDDPWMQSGEFVVAPDGRIRVAYLYNYCADYPDPRVFTTAGRLLG